MSKLQVRSSLGRPRASEQLSQSNPLDEALRLIDQLYNLRLVDRIARPRDRSLKQAELGEFGGKLQALHSKMNKIRSEILENSLSEPTPPRGRSIFGSATNKTALDWRKYIRLIETRYNQVLIEGSFKYCRRVCELLGLKFLASLELMLVEDWAHECLENRKMDNCC